MVTLSWIGNFFIVAGLWGIGNKRRHAFLLSIAGESAWIAVAYMRHDWALASVCTIFLLMAIRGWIKWA